MEIKTREKEIDKLRYKERLVIPKGVIVSKI